MAHLGVWLWLVVLIIFAVLAIVGHALLKKAGLSRVIAILGSLGISAVLTAVIFKFLFISP